MSAFEQSLGNTRRRAVAPAPIAAPVPRRLLKVLEFLRQRPHWTRSRIYRIAPEYPDLVLKFGKRSVLIDLDVADRIEAELQTARFNF